MHELSICQALLDQVENVARDHGARRVSRVALRIGALSGIEPELLEHAFVVARAGGVAGEATLEIEMTEPVVRCSVCGATGVVAANRLLCPGCGDWRVDLIEGREMVLAQVALEFAAASESEAV